MNFLERAKQLAKVEKVPSGIFYIRNSEGIMEPVLCIDEMRRLAKQVGVLGETLKEIGEAKSNGPLGRHHARMLQDKARLRLKMVEDIACPD